MAQEKVKTYDLIKLLESENLFSKLLGKGLIPVKFLNDKEIYECYLSYFEKGEGKMDAYFLASEEFGCSTKTVERVVIKMES